MRLGIGAAAAAIVCCAGLPAIGLVGGLTVGAIVGLGLGVLVVGAVVWAATVTVRRRLVRARCGEGLEPE